MDISTSLSDFTYAIEKIHVEEGAMVCQGCEHVYLIKNGIPNMVSIIVICISEGEGLTCIT